MNNTGHTQSLVKGLEILGAFSRERREFTAAELAGTLGISRPTAYRLARTLESCGFLRYDARSRTFSVGPAAFAVGSLFLPHSLTEAIDDVMEDLLDATQSTIHVGAFDGKILLMIAARESLHRSRVVSRVGEKSPLHASASGKALLASLDLADALAVVRAAGMPALAPRTITDEGRLILELDEIRKRGYATAVDEFAVGLHSFAVAIGGHAGSAPHTLSISHPSGLAHQPGEEERLVTSLKNAARHLDSVLARFPRYI